MKRSNLSLFILISLALHASLFVVFDANAQKAKTLYLDDAKMESISVVPGRSTILSFPTRPSKVIVGNQGLFAVEYVENDLAIAAVKAPAHSNLFVYLEGRRFGFDLHTVSSNGDEIVLVRDADHTKVKGRARK